MDKHKAVILSLVHFVWAIGLCMGAYYVEYGIMNIFMQFGVVPVVTVNVVLGFLLFILFYKMEKKMVQQELSKPVLFIFSTYMIPFSYQWIMLVRINENFTDTDSQGMMLTIMFMFTCLFMGICLLARGMTALFLFIKAKMEENKPLI